MPIFAVFFFVHPIKIFKLLSASLDNLYCKLPFLSNEMEEDNANNRNLNFANKRCGSWLHYSQIFENKAKTNLCWHLNSRHSTTFLREYGIAEVPKY